MARTRLRRWRALRRWLILAWVIAGALALPAFAAAQVGVRRVDASAFPTVRLTVVTTKPSSLAPTLAENGVPAIGLRAENLGRAKSAALLIDQSKSMRGKPFADAVAAARAFVSRKPHEDRIAVVSFGAQALQLTGFSTATIDADIGLRTLGVDARTGTALYDAVAVAARSLASEPLAGRVIIVLTDGADFGSTATIDDAIAAARSAGATVYAIGIEGEEFSRAPLEQLARDTGGSYFPAASTAVLKAVYAAVAEELRRTWRVEYVTSARPGERVTLEAEVVGQGSGTSSFEVPAALGGSASSGREPSRLLPKTVYASGWGPWVFGGIVGLIVLAAAGIAFAVPRSAWIRQRLAPHIGAARPRAEQSRERRQPLALSALYAVTERAFGRRRSWGRLQRLLWRAAVPLRTVEFVYLTVGCGLFLALAVAIAATPPVVVPAAFAAGVLGPVWFVWLKARRRVRAFEDQLPDMLMTLAASLKAGHSFRQGIQSVVDEGQPPASTEFNRVLTEARLGRPIDDALVEMAARIGSKDFEYVVTAVAIQREVGGGLAGLFDMVAETVRHRQQFQRKIRSLTAMGRMSAYVLITLPFFIAFAVTVLNKEYMEPLFNTGTGHLLIVIGLAMMAFGSVILKKIVSFRG